MRGVLALLLVLWLLPGCSQWEHQLGASLPEGYENTARGLTLAAVLADLGPPLRYSAGDSGLVMAWEAWNIREDTLGFSLGFAGADLLEVDWGDARISGDFLVISFDDERRVSGAFRARRDGDIGGGAALQPLGSLVSVVDVNDLLRSLPQHRWGASQLLPPAEALNNAQRPGMGDTAVEQRGTPGGAGQGTQGWRE